MARGAGRPDDRGGAHRQLGPPAGDSGGGHGSVTLTQAAPRQLEPHTGRRVSHTVTRTCPSQHSPGSPPALRRLTPTTPPPLPSQKIGRCSWRCARRPEPWWWCAILTCLTRAVSDHLAVNGAANTVVQLHIKLRQCI